MSPIEVLDPLRMDELRPLWEALNRHHIALGTPFSGALEARTWGARRDEMLGKARGGSLRVWVAPGEGGALRGYCVATVSREGVGEIDSLYVDEGQRGQGLGTAMGAAALAWMDGLGARAKKVAVHAGNERAAALYRRLGFAARLCVMEIPPQA